MVGVNTILTLNRNEIVFLKNEIKEKRDLLIEKIKGIESDAHVAEYNIEKRKYMDMLIVMNKQLKVFNYTIERLYNSYNKKYTDGVSLNL